MSRRQEYADTLGVSVATIDNYQRALREQGKRITIATLRVHQRGLAPGRDPDLDRAGQIRRMRDKQQMTWSAIGEAFGFTGTRACAIYRQYANG